VFAVGCEPFNVVCYAYLIELSLWGNDGRRVGLLAHPSAYPVINLSQMDYLDRAWIWIQANMRLIRVAGLALVVLFEIRAVVLIGLALGLVYYFAPEVRPYWPIAFQYFVAGFQRIL